MCCNQTGDEKGDDEAEYAWLPYHSIKPFAPGDVSGNETGQAPGDTVLQACVVQAEAALVSANSGRQPVEDGTDSDGGWGVSREVGALLRAACGFCLVSERFHNGNQSM